MIGIDLVDLNDPLLKKRNQRALELILNPGDKLIDHPHLFWLLWAAKEAAFKCDRAVKSFNPKSIPIEIVSYEKQIKFSSSEFLGNFIIEKDHLVALAFQEREPAFQIKKKDSVDWRKDIREEILHFFYSKGIDVNLSTDVLGLPLLNGNPISISHHGQFGGFAYCESSAFLDL